MTKITAVDAIYKKVTFHIIPFLLISYCFAVIDRMNIGIAQLRMGSDLELSTLALSFGAGIFFLGYVMMEVPASLLMARTGVRYTFTRILLAWGILSSATAFVSTPEQLYLVRFLLGMAEAGFYPGVIFYLTRWYPNQRRGMVIGLFTCATGMGGLIAGPVAGAIMTYTEGLWTLSGWQWMFILMGLPTCVLGCMVYRVLPEAPATAPWLDTREKQLLIAALDPPLTSEQQGQAFYKQPLLYLVGFIWMTQLAGIAAIWFWMPTMLQQSGLTSPVVIGMYSALPYVVSWGALFYWSKHSERRNERRLHYSGALFTGALGFIVAALGGTYFPVVLAGLIIATAGTYAGTPMLWGIATEHFRGERAAPAIALINSIGLLGGFFSPVIIAVVAGPGGSAGSGMLVLATLLGIGALANLKLPSSLQGRGTQPHSADDGADIPIAKSPGSCLVRAVEKTKRYL